jgi:hypothetical protein
MRGLGFVALLLALPGAASAAGDVSVVTVGGKVSIHGDGGANEFTVKHGTDAMGNDVLVVEGQNGTTVGGQPKAEIPLPAGNGDGTKVSEVEIFPGAGDDRVTVSLAGLPEGKRLDELGIEDEGADSGNDTVLLDDVLLRSGGKLKVKHGEGDDTTDLDDCDAGRMNFTDTAGSNDVELEDCNVFDQLRIDLGPGPNDIEVEDCFYRQAKINTKGSKTDVEPSRAKLRSRVSNTTGGKISFGGTPGGDEIVFENSQLESVSVKAGDGNDLVSTLGTSFDALGLDGGPGALDCFDDLGGNAIPASFKTKGFEPGACKGAVVLEYFGLGADPIDEPPQDAVAWRTNNPEIGHLDGPFALPGAENPLALPVLDPLTGVDPAHWADPDLCDWIHLHDAFEGHGDPAPGPPDTESACGHGALEWARLVPAS